MFNSYHFHIETTFDTTDSVKLSKLTKKDIYSPKLVVTFLHVFPNLFPCVYEPRHEETEFCPCDNKGADQLCSNSTADQRFLFSLH